MSTNNTFNFSKALFVMKNLKLRVQRLGWNGKGMFVFNVPANKYPSSRNENNTLDGIFEENLVPYSAYLAIKTVDGTVTPWLPSQTDLDASDWCVMESEEEDIDNETPMSVIESVLEVLGAASVQGCRPMRFIKINLDSRPEDETLDNSAEAVTPAENQFNIKSSFNVTGEHLPLPDSVTVPFINNCIKKVKYKTLKNTSAMQCFITLNNSFVSIGSIIIDSTLSVMENESRAYADAFDKLWELFGYVLSMLIHCDKNGINPLNDLFTIDPVELINTSNSDSIIFSVPVPNKLTHCVAVLCSNFAVTGESSCVNPDNFDLELGKGIAYSNACNKLKSLHDFLLIDLAHHCTEL